MLVNVAETKDWDLIVILCHWSHRHDLPKPIANHAYKAAWKHTDAYGELGHIPCQGYDWSGFRDSSAQSTASSANAIREALAHHGITTFNAWKE
jgi:hypothetical protein